MGPSRKFLTLIAVFAILVLGNLFFLDYKTLNGNQAISSSNQAFPHSTPSEVPFAPPIATSAPGCDSNCQSYIDSKIAAAKASVLQALATPQAAPAPSTAATQTNQPSNLYAVFGANGATQSTSWIDVPGSQMNFSISNYPGAKKFYFQANLRSDAPDKGAWARVVDVGTGADIVGSDMTISGSLTSVFQESGPITIPSSTTAIKLQVHSLNGNYAYVEGSRIRISY